MSNDYYVYEWIRLDTNETFYVGKGKGSRAYVPKKNNSYFMRIYEKYDTAVCILEGNLSCEKALSREQEYIYDYVFNLGYGINIKGYRESEVGLLVNFTWGGEGTEGRKCSEKTKEKISKANRGKSHPQTEITKEIIRNKLKAYSKTEEHRKHISESLKGRILNPEALQKMILWTKTADRSEIHCKNISNSLKGKKKSLFHRKAISEVKKNKGDWVGADNPKADAIAVIFPSGKVLKFKTKTDAKEIVPRTIIRRCLKSKEPYKVPKNYRRRYGYLEGIRVELVNQSEV